MDKRIHQTLLNLQRNNMAGYYAESKQELIARLALLIQKGERVGFGDSVTLEETGVFEWLRGGEFVLNDKHRPGLTPEEKRAVYLKNFDVDTFLTGTNAVTVDGKLFNIDGNGSRVAPMLYGPKQVVVVAGINKLTDTAQEAVERARQVAAPLDAARLHKDTPCVKLGKCVDCRHAQRICNDFVLIAGQFVKDRIKVILVNQAYGF